MTIAEMRERCKAALSRGPRDLLILGVLLFSCLASFGLGFLAGREAGQGASVTEAASPLVPESDGRVVASKNGTKYYLPWCGGADRISDANRVWFASAEEAQAKGYSPAANCDGL